VLLVLEKYQPTGKGGAMIKADFVEKVAERTGLTRILVKSTIESFLDCLREALEQGQRIEFRNFGVFQVKVRPPKVARNPKTGERVDVPQRKKVTFKPSRALKLY